KSEPVMPRTELAKAEPPSPKPDSGAVNINVDRAPRAALTGPARANAEYRRANDLLNQGRIEGALAAYGEALRADPRHVPARQAMVVVLLEQGRGADATTALREGITAVPQNIAWPMLLARLQIDANDARGAT